MAYDEELGERIREMLAEEGEVDERAMFGGLAFMVKGHMCCGVIKDDLMVRVGPETAERLLDEPQVRPMDFTGRPMKGYLYVSGSGLGAEKDLRRYIGLARDFVGTLPPK